MSLKKHVTMLACLFLLSFIIVAVSGSIRAGGSYLYEDGKDAYPVIEYLKDSKEYTDSDGIPTFLKSDYPNDRVVEFYSPWCGHCQKFKPQYIAFAKQFTRFLPSNKKVDIFAVSCVVHRDLCRDQNIRGFPSIKSFKAGAEVDSGQKMLLGDILKRERSSGDLLPKAVALQLNVPLSGKEEASPTTRGISNIAVINPKNDVEPFAYNYKIKRDTYSDASSSFLYALSTAIYMDNSPLKSKRFLVFQDWLDLLSKTLPVEWETMQGLMNGIIDHLAFASQGHQELTKLINEYGTGLQKESWSSECTKGKVGMGYTCGLWELFHIMTVGFVERSDEIRIGSDTNTLTPSTAAQRLRDYIEQFFACDVCRKHFLDSFDSCVLERCTRLSHSDSDHKELALWLWEFHNAVNIRLLEEDGELNNRVVTQDEKWAKQWPSKKLCPNCWGQNPWPEWDKVEVYNFLKKTYWVSPEIQPYLMYPPESSQNSFYYIVYVFLLAFIAHFVIKKVRTKNVVQNVLRVKGN